MKTRAMQCMCQISLRRERNFIARLFVVLFACVFGAWSVYAQRVLAVSTTLSLTREAGRTYVQIVDLTRDGRVEAAEILPGAVLLSMPQFVREGQSVVLSSGPARASSQPVWDYISLLDLSTFGLSSVHASPTGETGFVAALTNAPEPCAIRIGAVGAGFIEAWPLETQRSVPRWELPGAPVAAVRLGSTSLVAVLCRPASKSGAILRVADMADAKGSGEEVLLENERLFDAVPTGLAANADGTNVFVLLSGHAVDRPSGEPLSWLHALRTWTPPTVPPVVSGATRAFRPARPIEVGLPVEIPGVALASDRPLLTVGTASCWVATRTQGSGFAHVVRVTLGVDGFTKDAQIALTDVTHPVRIAVEPSCERLAVGVDRTLEIWRGNERGEIRHVYDQPLMTVCWADTGLFIGEGGSVHRVEPDTAAPVRSMALQSGWIMNVIAMETAQPVVGNRVPSKLPGQILFHAEAAGQEVKAFRVGQDEPRGSPWHVSFNRDEMPWLVIHPTSGITPNVVYMGVDPGQYTQGSLASNMLTVETAHQTQPHDIDLRILPLARSEVRRILWIWPDEAKGGSFRDASDPRGMRDLGELLAAPPHVFSHREAVVPVSEPLDPFTVVVLEAAAAIRGAVTRQALLEYVMHGGSLLFIGRYLPDADPEALAAWLDPVQVEVDTHTLLEGTFTSTRDTRVGRHWRDVRLSDGCAVNTDDALAIAVHVAGNPQRAALVLRSYGRGRIAILAAPTPLLGASLSDAEHRRFAEDLFGWLAQAGTHTGEQDMDGDGIQDDIEDKNGNGLVDPGETDYLDPDTDGDGVDDGMEDTNLNGVVDDGETSPLNPDSNSNGILDGVDPAPLPMEGAPVVTGVSPAQCPAEGGVPALISGRNFAPGASVWFGDTVARKVRVLRSRDALVEVPPCASPAGGDVPVRVRGSSGGAEAALPTGFHYGPLSHVTLTLKGPATAEKKEGAYCGTISIRLDAPADVTVNQVLLLLKATPSDGFAWEEQPLVGAPETRKRLVTRTTQSGDLLVVVLNEKPGKPLRGGLGEIAWRMTPPTGTTGPLRFTVEQPRVMTHSNWPLDVAVHPATVALP